MQGGVFFWCFGILGTGSDERSLDRGEVYFSQRARCHGALTAFGRARAVKGADWRQGDVPEQGIAGGPHIAFATPQPGQITKNALAFLPVGLALDPSADSVAVLARRQFHRDQYVRL